MTFDTNVGGYLAKAFAQGYATHAYVVVGEKQALPSLLNECAVAVMCPSHNHDGCAVCQKVNTRQHQDVLYLPVDSEKTRLSVADVNFLVEESNLRSVDSGTARVFLIDASNSCSGVGSDVWQNKLLKTLEEPLKGVHIFIGVTDAEALLPTVRSRCQVLKQTKVTTLEVQQRLESCGYDKRACQLAGAMSGGSVQTGERLLANVKAFDALDCAVATATEMTSSKVAVKYAYQIVANKEHINLFLQCFCLLLRESVFYRLCPQLCALPELTTEVKKVCNNYTISAVTNCIQVVNDCKRMLDDGGNVNAVVDDLLSNILEMRYKCRI